MYRLSFTKLLNNTSLVFSSKNSTHALCNAQKHNFTPLCNRPQNQYFNNTSPSLRYLQHTNNTRTYEPFSILSKTYKELGRVQALTISNILKEDRSEFLSNDQSLLLLQCCGHAIVDKTPAARSSLCNEVWAKLEEYDVSFNIQHYNKYIEICIENKVKLQYDVYISKMGHCEPNEETYRLLLQSACQLGDMQQANKIITEMKNNGFVADEKVFNALVLGNAVKGGLNDAQTVLSTMQAMRIPPSTLTYYYLLQGVAQHGDYKEFVQVLETHTGLFNEIEFLNLLQVLGLNGNHTWVDEVIKKLHPNLTKRGSSDINLLCMHLVHMNQLDAALYYYKLFVLPRLDEDNATHSVYLFSEVLLSGMPVEKVIEIIKGLAQTNYTYIIQKLTEIVMKRGMVDAAWDLFPQMPCLRPHYFWPILLKASRDERENGVFAVINKMFEYNVKPDMDTLEFYVIPHCDTTDGKNLLLRLKNLGFSYKEILTPLISFYLREQKLSTASKLCIISDNISIIPERLIQPLCRAWINSGDSNSTILLLKRFYDTKESNDSVGKTLLRLFKACKTPANYNNFLTLVKMTNDESITITTTSADSILYIVNNINHRTLKKSMHIAIQAITATGLNNTYTLIPHPSTMTVTELENHLSELESKHMETRGVIRKLIQNHCRLGNETRVAELRQKFLDAGYVESAGMKAALFHSYVIQGKDTRALNMYRELKLQHPKFVVDDYKIIDFATLLVQSNKYEAAVKLLSENRAVRGPDVITRNCWKLLTAAEEENELHTLYNLLLQRGYCVPCNIILGPLVKIHLKRNDLKKAVRVYAECAEKHKCTPLQVELLCAVVDGENQELLQEVLNITAKVYGTEGAHISFISALSQSGLHNSLRKFLLEMPKVPKKEIIKLCERWLQCNDRLTLETLSKAVVNFPTEQLDETIAYKYLLKLHGANNDCESAVKLYRQLLELRVNIPKSLTEELLRMVHRCKYVVPDDLLQAKAMS